MAALCLAGCTTLLPATAPEQVVAVPAQWHASSGTETNDDPIGAFSDQALAEW